MLYSHDMLPKTIFRRSCVVLLALSSGWGCGSKSCDSSNSVTQKTLFTLLDSARTHVQFSNQLSETGDKNILLYQYYYNGAGVAIGDVNGDGLQDIYFSSNMADDKLYLNKGNMQFADITAAAGVEGRSGGWKTGVTMVDINGDNKTDIYVCYSGSNPIEMRRNQLFINQGNDKSGTPVFTEEAKKYGLADGSFSTKAYFFDYDRDGDLDMLLLNHNPRQFTNLDDATVPAIEKIPDPMSGTKLYKNDKGHFVDITLQAGINNSGLSYGLGAGIADINGDGWPDIYVSNDYAVPDRLYINNKNGGFTDQLPAQIGHTSLFSMGNDVADINNDGLPDIYTLDMLPEDNLRQKNLFTPDNYELFAQNLRVGFYYQYMRNMLQMNNGNNTFSETGQLAGVSNTDWSWSPLLADYDNDGWKDLFVSNGLLRDLTNNDFVKYRNDYLSTVGADIRGEKIVELLKHMPSTDVKSYFFKNTGNSGFADKSNEWGITEAANSNGAAYADLDNDGDLDLVVNNINKKAFIYENGTAKQLKNHYLQVKLKGLGQNTQGIGAKVFLYQHGRMQYAEQMPDRGYQSGVTLVLHFGLGAEPQVDSVRIVWPLGSTQLLTGLKADQSLWLKESDSKKNRPIPERTAAIFKEIASSISYLQERNSLNDFKRQPLMINPMSFGSPVMVKSDVNADGLEDVFIGGAYGQPAHLYIQQKSGRFVQKIVNAFEADHNYTDAAAVFFDANGDGRPDLYVASGGYDNLAQNDTLLQDRLYLNNGQGGFTRAAGALPKMLSSKGTVAVADVNGDGHADLFIGGRVVPGRYPETPQSFLLLNDGKGHFIDQTRQLAPTLQHIGMVSDAAWTDLNRDGRPDLVVVGEWMPVSIFINLKGKLVDEISTYLGKQYSGWWNKICISDLNKDGHPDLVIGNIGLNTQCKATDQEPAEMFYKDFDDNGALDPIFCFYNQHKSYPYMTRDEMLDQMSMMRVRFPDYQSFANAGVHDLFTAAELKGAGYLKANHFATTLFLSYGSGKLKQAPLPVEVQNSPVFTLNAIDYDHDGNADLLLCGNINKARLRFGKYDANYGLLLKGDGKGGFRYIPQKQSGFKLKGDVRSVVEISHQIVIGINQSALVSYKLNKR